MGAMTATTTAPPAPPAAKLAGRGRGWMRAAVVAPTDFAIASAGAFYLVRPGVNDLWAARARASAASHGVGLDYWFSWFGGGSTPGNYSVLTPYASALIGTELVGALSALVAVGLVAVAVRGTRYPAAATWVAAVGAALNIWS